METMSVAPSAESKHRSSRRFSQRQRRLRCALLAVIAACAGQAALAFNGDMVHVQVTAAAASTAVPNADCTLIVPRNPLSATGLATPYQLVATDPALGPCNETNTSQSAFVQAAIFDPATGAISIYHPLVIDQGTRPAVAPVVPTLPANAIVALWFGFNANELTLTAGSNALSQGNCVNGIRGSVFGQYAYCNAPAFFKAANAAVASGQLTIPPVGTATDGLPCPTVRDFFVVDQDQSDNLPTLYLVTTRGQLAQYSAKNIAALKGAVSLGNPSDNRLTDVFIDGALGCRPFMAPDLGNPGQMVPALALNELQARSGQATPVALVPAGDPMTESAGNENRFKANQYRLGVDQPRADAYVDVDTARYCRQMLRIAPARMVTNKTILSNFYTPDAAAANSLYTFLAQRFVATYSILTCETLINIANPVSVTVNNAGVATRAAVNTTALNRAIQKLASRKAEDDNADSSAKALKATE
jgi:hypothetical protein